MQIMQGINEGSHAEVGNPRLKLMNFTLKMIDFIMKLMDLND